MTERRRYKLEVRVSSDGKSIRLIAIVEDQGTLLCKLTPEVDEDAKYVNSKDSTLGIEISGKSGTTVEYAAEELALISQKDQDANTAKSTILSAPRVKDKECYVALTWPSSPGKMGVWRSTGEAFVFDSETDFDDIIRVDLSDEIPMRMAGFGVYEAMNPEQLKGLM